MRPILSVLVLSKAEGVEGYESGNHIISIQLAFIRNRRTMIKLDHKQQKIVSSWLQRAMDLSKDTYASFISLWISFNAYCYSQYAAKANKHRADLRNDAGLRNITPDPLRAEGTVRLDNARYRLNIEKPGRILIIVSERYTEDIVFTQFAREYQPLYQELLRDVEFEKAVAKFQRAIRKKGGRHFIVNMARHREYSPDGDYDTMVQRHIIVPFENKEDLEELKNVLYQVRCNVFHGEKLPGLMNDDKIVRTAQPVLERILRRILKEALTNRSSGRH
jgi:hypothetical protein